MNPQQFQQMAGGQGQQMNQQPRPQMQGQGNPMHMMIAQFLREKHIPRPGTWQQGVVPQVRMGNIIQMCVESTGNMGASYEQC
jgi:hypothetical protein